MGFRTFKDRFFSALVLIFTACSVVPLFLILFQLFKNGIGALSLELFTSLPKPPGEEGGGILNAILGTFMLIFIASAIAVPAGVLAGVFLAEFEGKFRNLLSVMVNALQGVPSIVLGIVAYTWVVVPAGGFSAFAGGVALALMMFPIIVKTTEEAVKLVPLSLKEASYALGANYTKTILKVVLPASMGGIISGIVLAVSRIAGETAPLLFTAFGNPFLNLNPGKPVEALPLLIFKYALSPYETWHTLAWGASVVLIGMVLILNIILNVAVRRKWKPRW